MTQPDTARATAGGGKAATGQSRGGGGTTAAATGVGADTAGGVAVAPVADGVYTVVPADEDAPCAAGCAAERRRGRPRSARAEQAILGAVLAMLDEGIGYDALTVEAVAARAGVGKATIYRRWPNKDGLFVDAVRSVVSVPFPEPAGVSVRDDLIVMLEAMRAGKATGLATRLLPRLYVEMARYPQVLERYMRVAVEGRRARLREVILRGVATGELRPDIDVDLTMALLSGPILIGSLVAADPALLAPGAAARIVDTVLAGVGADPQRADSASARRPARSRARAAH